MADRIPENLQQKLSARLSFYKDIGIDLFYHDRAPILRSPVSADALPTVTAAGPGGSIFLDAEPVTFEISESIAVTATLEDTLPKTLRKPVLPAATSQAPAATKVVLPAAKSSLFDATERISGDSLLKIRDDIGECTRCKLHKARNKIVFADGDPKAQLMFVGEGPGRDEDMQGLPFVGRAGKLLTQMIEAMGLQRKEVYICNVVKCRPPENRLPEPDEIKTCSPFLFRQIEVVDPKVIVCLGACSAQTLLQTTRGISHFRGQWQEFRGRKLMATYHPAYLLRNPVAKADVWKDLQMVMAELGLAVKRGAKSTSAGKTS
jgi:uracil-DNA glycosylase